MTRLGRYIFDEAFRPFVFFVAALAAIVWLSQSLRYVNVIVDQGQSAFMFLYLIVLMLPSLLIFVIPAALLFAVFYALFRLQGDSELVVLAAAGRSRLSIAWPLVVLAAVAALLIGGIVLIGSIAFSIQRFFEWQQAPVAAADAAAPTPPDQKMRVLTT